MWDSGLRVQGFGSRVEDLRFSTYTVYHGSFAPDFLNARARFLKNVYERIFAVYVTLTNRNPANTRFMVKRLGFGMSGFASGLGL